MMFLVFFFFFKQKTAYEMRISDWSSDVCSSDLLKKRLALTARVLRDGAECEVPVSAIVPGDMVLLSAGNLIPADGLVIEASDFLVSEASMTGESFPVEKRPGRVAADAPNTKRTNCVFLGGSGRSAQAKVLVARTNTKT